MWELSRFKADKPYNEIIGASSESKMRKDIVEDDQPFGFMPRRSTTDTIFGSRMMMKKWREGQEQLHCVFISSSSISISTIYL